MYMTLKQSLRLALQAGILFLWSAQASSAQESHRFWTLSTTGPEVANPATQVRIQAKAKKLYTLDFQAIKQELISAPTWQEQPLSSYGKKISLPLPNGTFAEFMLAEFSVMEKSLQMQYPDIRCYTGQGSGGSILKLDITPHGLHAMISGPGYTYFIDPHLVSNQDWVMVYDKKDFIPSANKPQTEFEPEGDVDAIQKMVDDYEVLHGKISTPNGTFRKEYRIAVAASREYTNFHGGTVPLALSAINTTINRVNSVYERDFSIRLLIVANNNLIIYTNANPGPYTNQSDASTTINQNQTNINTVIGAANYDIGHIFTTGAGGLAGLGVVCTNSNKARGVTGIAAPVGDPFDIDYVSHEIGHQFAGTHTFNGNTGSCAGSNHSPQTAYEPGSGTTIMAYAGICSPQNIQTLSDDHFHGGSYRQVIAFTNTGNGASCAANIPTNNTPPVVNAGTTYIIPRNTPFMLTGSATDANTTDTLSYCWEQMDLGPQGAPDLANSTSAPIFRSFSPTLSPTRVFPAWSDILTNNQTMGEILPNVARTLRFQLNVRDNRPAGGGTNFDTVSITVGTSAPFTVTAPNTAVTWTVFSNQTITWNRGATHQSPINCDSVRILMSLNGGLTWPIVLSDGAPNTGSFQVTVPNNPSTACRVMVMGKGNIFFDISNVNFTIPIPSIPDFSVSLLNTTGSTCTQDSGLFRVRIASLLGFNTAVALSVSGLPANVTARFSADTLIPPDTIELYLRAGASAIPGNYTFTVTGIGSSGTKTATGTLTIVNAVPGSVSLNAPVNNATNQALKPGFSWSAAAGAIGYEFQLSTSNTFTSLVDSARGLLSPGFITNNFLNPNTTYFWRVRGINPCGNGAFSSVFSFTTENVICTTFSSTTPLVIPASGTGIYLSNLNIPVGNIIRDINVRNIRGTHTRISDLSFAIRSAQGLTVQLMPQSCTPPVANFYISFDQQSSNTIIPCPPTDSLTYRPIGNLNDFNGEIGCGTWTLIVTDNVNGQGGTLQGWDLDICYEACTPAQGISAGSITPSTSRCAGQFVNISVPFTSNTSVNYHWLKNGDTIPGQSGIASTSGTLTLNLINLVQADSGNYALRIVNCCTTVVSGSHTLSVRSTPPKPTITQVVDTLFSSAPIGNQWFRGGNILIGQNQPKIVPNVNGNYTVIVTVSNCASPASDPLNFTISGLQESVFDRYAPIIYPNPGGQLFLTLEGLVEGEPQNIRVTLLTITGQQLMPTNQFLVGTEPISIPVHDLSSGMYILSLEMDGQVKRYKWIKE